jgi:hypothetical protein
LVTSYQGRFYGPASLDTCPDLTQYFFFFGLRKKKKTEKENRKKGKMGKVDNLETTFTLSLSLFLARQDNTQTQSHRRRCRALFDHHHSPRLSHHATSHHASVITQTKSMKILEFF